KIMILISNLRKFNLVELNAYLMKSFEQKIYDRLSFEQRRNEQLLNLLSKSKEELHMMNMVN
ncbi:MAG: hypothetical protein ACKVQB_08735, partial [Bacteroidia bacterium]